MRDTVIIITPTPGTTDTTTDSYYYLKQADGELQTGGCYSGIDEASIKVSSVTEDAATSTEATKAILITGSHRIFSFVCLR